MGTTIFLKYFRNHLQHLISTDFHIISNSNKWRTVETELLAAAPIKFDEILVQNLLSKNYVLLKGAAYIKVRPLIPFLR